MKLAKELGVCGTTISKRMLAGQSEDYIREQIAIGRERVAKIKESKERFRKLREEGVAEAGTVSGVGASARSYVPGRRALHAPQSTMPVSVNGKVMADPQKYADPVSPARRELLGDAELRLAIAQADEREAKAAILHGSHVPIKQVNAIIGGAHAKFKDRLFRVPAEVRDRLAVCGDPVECERIVREGIVAAVRELRVMVGIKAEAESEEGV